MTGPEPFGPFYRPHDRVMLGFSCVRLGEAKLQWISSRKRSRGHYRPDMD